jgi:cobalt/nickel transport system ATP-binding protein
MALDLCPRVIVLYEGAIVADGLTKDILINEPFLQEYGLELPLSMSGRERK